MKTIEELYKAVLADKALKEKCVEAVKANKLGDFLKEMDCNATVDEIKTFFESKKEVSFDELDAVSGGFDACEVTSFVDDWTEIAENIRNR